MLSKEHLTTYLANSPWITLHYSISDEQAKEIGITEIQLHCLVCREVKPVRVDASKLHFEESDEEYKKRLGMYGDSELRAIRDEFEKAHQHPESGLKPRQTWR